MGKSKKKEKAPQSYGNHLNTKALLNRNKHKTVEIISTSEEDNSGSDDQATNYKVQAKEKHQSFGNKLIKSAVSRSRINESQDQTLKQTPAKEKGSFTKALLNRNKGKTMEITSTSEEDNSDNSNDDHRSITYKFSSPENEENSAREKSVKLNGHLEQMTKLTSLASDENFPATRRHREFDRRNLEGIDCEARRVMRHLRKELREKRRQIREVDEISRLREKVLRELEVKKLMLGAKCARRRQPSKRFQPERNFQFDREDDVLQRMLNSLTELRLELPNFVISSSELQRHSNWDQDDLLEVLKKLDSI